jgi:hypothetical protein
MARARDRHIELMIDTSVSTHMPNSRDTLEHGTVRACDVDVMDDKTRSH